MNPCCQQTAKEILDCVEGGLEVLFKKAAYFYAEQLNVPKLDLDCSPFVAQLMTTLRKKYLGNEK